ncbi:MAG: RNA polymerase sigma factor [Planctomycetia bacterium]|nr:RNA polymerase sigma factor [Planctomycetia bacterium]
MAQGQLKSVVSFLVGLARGPVGGTLSDRQLLRQFVASQDQEAFATLVRRHGPLVLGVCRRLLRQEQDAEDVFQAVFALLARKADSPFWHESIGNWLYGVAYRLALRARARASVRRRHEEQAAAMQHPTNVEVGQASELRLWLDEELQRLPEKYRMPLLLCYLQGQSREDAARQLGWSAGEMKGRLERGRDLLRARLARRGLALSAAALPGVLGQEALAAIPETLIRFTTQAVVAGTLSAPAAALLQGALQTMFWTKVKAACCGMLAVAVLGTAGWCALYSAKVEATVLAPNTVEPKAAPQDAEPAKPTDGKLEARLSLTKREFVPGDAVIIQFTTKNVAKETLGLWSRSCSWGHEVYSLEVTDPAGQRWLLHEPSLDWRRNVPMAKDLKPGEEFSVDLDLPKLAGSRVPAEVKRTDPARAQLVKSEWQAPLAVGVYRIRGVYAAKNEFKGDPTWVRLMHLWEGRLVTEAVQVTIREPAAKQP